MAEYMGMRILAGALDYRMVVTKRPDLKTAIDTYLTSVGRSDLVVS
jgi:hypothetical protein